MGSLCRETLLCRAKKICTPFRLFSSPCRRLLLVRGFLRKSRTLQLPLLLPPFLQKGRLRGGGGSRDAPGAASRVASSPPARPVSSERGGSASGRSSAVRERASVSSAPSRAEDVEAARSQRTPVARLPLPRLPLPAHLCTLCEGMSQENLRRPAPILVPPKLPDLQLEKQGRIVGPVRGRAVLVTGLVARALAPLPVRGRERRRRDSSRLLSSCVRSRRDWLRSSDRYRSHRVRSRSAYWRDRSLSSDRYQSRRDHSRRDRLQSSDRYRSRRECSRSPASRGGCCDRLRSLDPPRRFSPLTVRSHGIEVDEPDVSCGRVWRQLRSPRLLLSQKRQLQWLLLWRRFHLLCRISPGFS